VIDVAQAPVHHHVTIDSTNTEARRLFDAGEHGPLWVLADEQTAGRGRLERRWVSEVGNVYATLMLPLNSSPGVPGEVASRSDDGEVGGSSVQTSNALTEHSNLTVSRVPRLPPLLPRAGEELRRRAPQIGFVVALAVADVAASYADEVKLKWPNDVLVGGAKVSGILCEVLSPDVIAVGCGINVAHAPRGLAYPVTHLAGATRDQVFAAYRERLLHWLRVWYSGFATVRDVWISRAIGMGETVTMSVGSKTHTGTFETIDDDGAIILRQTNGVTVILHAGDLVIPSLQEQRKRMA
jgi:BirA family transcriptional regulator, biotin operon repressor / biotin---[acetyl-CoA-carboxylase] ligase